MLTGIYGGTFDPVHLGHLRTALEVRAALGLDEVRFVPSRQPLHRGLPVAPTAQRLAMLQAAVFDQPGFRVDMRELERAGPSYTVDTLHALREEEPGRRLALILGMDAFLGLPTWHRWQEILQLSHIVVAHRPGWSPPASGPLGQLLAAVGVSGPTEPEAPAGRIIVLPVTPLDISSTDIRADVRRGGDPRFLVTEEVRRIILASGCYRDAHHEG
jgi:nicotinate-nucleotide adenylyltransferase